jgi:hypothetical protein
MKAKFSTLTATGVTAVIILTLSCRSSNTTYSTQPHVIVVKKAVIEQENCYTSSAPTDSDSSKGTTQTQHLPVESPKATPTVETPKQPANVALKNRMCLKRPGGSAVPPVTQTPPDYTKLQPVTQGSSGDRK